MNFGPLQVRKMQVGQIFTNCYIISDADSGEAIIVDPGGNAEEIADFVVSDGLSVVGIVNTHCHIDHILSNGDLMDRYACPIMIHSADADGLTNPGRNLSALVAEDGFVSPAADRVLEDGDEIALGESVLKVLHTPGHTPGGICLFYDGVLIAGDTLFAGGVGRCDLPGGSMDAEIESIKQRLMTLPDETAVLPGHGPDTTIGSERNSNPFLL